MKINQHQIAAFNAAQAARSFSRAAEALGVTQSSVTQNVAKFEAQVGARLFERRRGGLVLTPAGRKIHEVTEEIGFLTDLLVERMQEYARLSAGALRVAASAASPALTILARFQKRHPGIDLSFTNASWRECAEMLRRRDVDVAIMPEPEATHGLALVPVEERRLVALVFRGHPLFGRESLVLADLADINLVLSSARSFARWRLEEKARALGVGFSRISRVSSTSMAVEAVHHEIGVTVAALGALALPDNVRAIPIRDLSETYRLVVACNADARDLTIVRGFLSCID